MYKLYTDAATLNHGDETSDRSAGGILIINNGQQSQLKVPLQDAHDNHTAEFQICIAGLMALIKQIPPTKLKQTIVFFYTDSKILADSLDKQYAKHYQLFVDRILELEAQFQLVMNQWIPEAQNMGAHELAQQALHQYK